MFIADKSRRALPSVDVIDMEDGGCPRRAFRNELSGKQPALRRHADFFQQFAAQCGLGIFAVFDVTARQAPPIRVRPALRTSPGEKNAAIPINAPIAISGMSPNVDMCRDHGFCARARSRLSRSRVTDFCTMGKSSPRPTASIRTEPGSVSRRSRPAGVRLTRTWRSSAGSR